MTTDYLEPYRQMARAIRFVPPLPKERSAHLSLTRFTPIPPLGASLQPSISNSKPADYGAVVSPAVDPDHATKLIQAAVAQPTVLPARYDIPTNPGDRISALTPPNPPTAEPVYHLPKIPQPDPTWQPHSPEVNPEPSPASSASLLIEDHPPEDQPVESSLAEDQYPEFDRETAEPSIPETPGLESAQTQADQSAEAVSNWLESMTTSMENLAKQMEKAKPKSQIPAIACPRCGSVEVRKNGQRAGKQKYVCRDCGRQFADLVVADPKVSDPTTQTPKPQTVKQKTVAPFKSGKKSSKSAAKKQGKGFGAKMKHER